MQDQCSTIVGTRCLNTSYLGLTEKLKAHVLKPAARPIAVDFTNVHIVTMRRVDSDFAKVTQVFDYFVPDSQVLAFTIRLFGGAKAERVYGPTFMRECVINTPKPFSHYFLGASEDCLEKLVRFFRGKQPNLNLVGSHNGYFSPADEAAIVDDINRLRPDFLWVGLGTPKQQEWIFRNLKNLECGVVLAVGFAFDVNAGTKTDAPMWMQNSGLTWLYRLGAEPRRLFGRYVKYNSLYLYFLTLQILGFDKKAALRDEATS